MKSIDDIIKGLTELKSENKKDIAMSFIQKAFDSGKISEDLFKKAKYIRREGSPGNYTYIYKEGEGSGSSKKATEKEGVKKLDLSKHSDKELHDAKMIRLKNGKSENDPEVKQITMEQKKRSGTHISDMKGSQKLEAAKKLGIKDAEKLSPKELDKQLTEKNIEKQMKEFKEKKKEKDVTTNTGEDKIRTHLSSSWDKLSMNDKLDLLDTAKYNSSASFSSFEKIPKNIQDKMLSYYQKYWMK